MSSKDYMKHVSSSCFAEQRGRHGSVRWAGRLRGGGPGAHSGPKKHPGGLERWPAVHWERHPLQRAQVNTRPLLLPSNPSSGLEIGVQCRSRWHASICPYYSSRFILWERSRFSSHISWFTLPPGWGKGNCVEESWASRAPSISWETIPTLLCVGAEGTAKHHWFSALWILC